MKLYLLEKRLKFYLPLLVMLLVSFFPERTRAQKEQFLIDYDINYEIEDNGVTSITHRAIITNLQNDVIPTVYTFAPKQLNIYDVYSTTNDEEVEPKIEHGDKESLVSVTLEDYAIGEGRQNTISLNYKTDDIASKSGKIWNIYIPKIEIPETTTLYNVRLSIPKSFGQKIYLSPSPVIEKDEAENKIYYFTKETFKSTGIIAAFGEYQPINFKLKYQIKNGSILPSIKEVAFPPDVREYQNVSFKEINPKPHKIKLDEDGNTIATYILKPLKEMEIEVTGTARLYGRQINPDFGRNISGIPENLIKKYTQEQNYWEVNSPAIKEVVEELKDDSLNTTKNAQKIYNFIKNNISYDFDAVEKGLTERKGAETTITQEGKWTCMEYTDLFITLARSMGIPAREINGYAFAFDESDNPISINLEGGDFLHSWAEFYDPFYGWVQVDPTWGTTSGLDYFTKLDTNHFAFVVKGLSSEKPYSAGTYRFSDSEKLIDVALSQSVSDEDFTPQMKFQNIFNFNPIEIIKGNIKIKAENTGKVAAYDVKSKTIPSGGEQNLFISKEEQEIIFEDINGNKYVEKISD
jgi:transglutaminase-like putative cysteine protease